MPELESAKSRALQAALEGSKLFSKLGYVVVQCEHGLLIERRGHGLGILQITAGSFEFLLAGFTKPIFREDRLELIVERIVLFLCELPGNRTL